MIFGWLEHGRTDRWVLVDPVAPHPALHHGRDAMRRWAALQGRLRDTQRTAGPRRMPWPCQFAVKDSGDLVLRVWPCEPYGHPRAWTEADRVWRPALEELAACMAAEVACDVVLEWTSDAGVIERARTSPDLRGRGFIGWQRGEREPKLRDEPAAGDLKVTLGGAPLRIMPQGDKTWH